MWCSFSRCWLWYHRWRSVWHVSLWGKQQHWGPLWEHPGKARYCSITAGGRNDDLYHQNLKPSSKTMANDSQLCFCLQEGSSVPTPLISPPPPPPALALALEHPRGHPAACLVPPALVGASSHPRAMPLHRTSLLALEVSRTLVSVEYG